jgi:hypothetical protein
MSDAEKPPPMLELLQGIRMKPRLPKPREDLIRMIYGATPQIPLQGYSYRPSTPEETLTRCGEYVLKMQKKGFVHLKNPVSSPRQLYNANVRRSRFMSEPERDRPIEYHEIRLEPYQRFWMSTAIVRRISEEIKGLPFVNVMDKSEAYPRFMERAVALTCVLKTSGQLDVARPTRKSLQRSMDFFVSEIYTIRCELFQEWFARRRLRVEHCPASLIREFESFIPQAQTAPQTQTGGSAPMQRPDDNDQRVFDKVDHDLVLPAAYHTPPCFLTERSRAVTCKSQWRVFARSRTLIQNELAKPAARREAPVDQTVQPIDSRPAGPVHKPTIVAWRPPRGAEAADAEESEAEDKGPPGTMDPMTWLETDPLYDERTGDRSQNVFSVIQSLAEDVEIDCGVLVRPSPRNPFRRAGRKNVKPLGSERSLSGIRMSPSKALAVLSAAREDEETEEIPEEEAGEEPAGDHTECQATVQRLRSMGHSKRYDSAMSPDAFQFLADQTNDVVFGGEGKALHDRLAEIWDHLGFSVQQKLAMAVKYSHGAEDSVRFSEAMVVWEGAYAAVGYHNH